MTVWMRQRVCSVAWCSLCRLMTQFPAAQGQVHTHGYRHSICPSSWVPGCRDMDFSPVRHTRSPKQRSTFEIRNTTHHMSALVWLCFLFQGLEPVAEERGWETQMSLMEARRAGHPIHSNGVFVCVPALIVWPYASFIWGNSHQPQILANQGVR